MAFIATKRGTIAEEPGLSVGDRATKHRDWAWERFRSRETASLRTAVPIASAPFDYEPLLNFINPDRLRRRITP